LLSTSQRDSAVLNLSSVIGRYAFNPLVSYTDAGRRLRAFGFQIAKRCTAFKEFLTMRDVSTPASLIPHDVSVSMIVFAVDSFVLSCCVVKVPVMSY
jgi:hypothetical protein